MRGNDNGALNTGDVEYKYLQGFDAKHILIGHGALTAD
jgi:triosephosphate isomerase